MTDQQLFCERHIDFIQRLMYERLKRGAAHGRKNIISLK